MSQQVKRALRSLDLRPLRSYKVPDSHSSQVRILLMEDGSRTVLKIPFSAAKYWRELAMLTRLEPLLPVPRVLRSARPRGEDPGCLLLSHIDGLPLESPVDQDMSRQVGRLLGELHRVRMPGYGSDGPDGFREMEEGSWRGFLENRLRTWERECREYLAPLFLRRCMTQLWRMLEDLPLPGQAVALHMDFRPGNILARDGRVQGLIDFESSRAGPSEIDFVKIKEEVWEALPETQEAFLEGYREARPVPRLEETLPFYQMTNALGGVAWALRRGGDPAFLKSNLERLKLFL